MSGPLWKPFWTSLKKSISKIFHGFCEIFVAVGVGLQNFGFWPADPPKVDGTCPTQYFWTSWGSGEYVGSPVGHHRAGLPPLRPGFLKNSDHRLRCHFGFWRPRHHFQVDFGNCPTPLPSFFISASESTHQNLSPTKI